jgi:hypothetical protein
MRCKPFYGRRTCPPYMRAQFDEVRLADAAMRALVCSMTCRADTVGMEYMLWTLGGVEQQLLDRIQFTNLEKYIGSPSSTPITVTLISKTPITVTKSDIVYIESKNNKGRSHRDDGPAVVHSDGRKYWCQDGEIHREDGPAVEWPDGRKWFTKGNQIT